MDALVNRQIGEFVLDQAMGGSTAAAVYRAFQPTLNRYVALKVILLPGESAIEEARSFERRFTQEAEVLTSLEHPHIVPIYHYGVVASECTYIAMRLMHGSLQLRLQDAPFPPEQVVDIAIQLMDGLSYAHKKGVIHHDIKPANILFDEAGSACLTDFGLSNVTQLALDMHEINALMSTAMYAAPEKIRNASTDHRSDIYSIGVIMYQMLTGRLPFDVEDLSITSMLQTIERDDPVPLRSIAPEIPAELERVVMQALRKEPRQRFFDAAEMMDALITLPGGNRQTFPRASSVSMLIPAAVQRTARQRRARWVFLAFVVGTLLGLLLLLNRVVRENDAMQPPTIVAEMQAGYEAAAPTSAEIARARARLGEDGFIAFITCSLDSQFQATRAREMGDFASAYELGYEVYDSRNDANVQLTMLERARMEGAKAIILCPLRPSLLADSLTSIQRARIPLVLTTAISNSYGGVMLETDNLSVGRLAGDYVGSLLASEARPGRIVVLDSPGTGYSDLRVQGFMEALSAHVPGAELISRLPGGSDRAFGTQVIAEVLNSGETIDAIFSVADTGAYGAIDALQAARISPEAVLVVSVNGESLALDEISNGEYLRATVEIGREMGSRGALDAVVKMLGGGTLPEILTLPEANLITRDNLLERAPNE